MDRRDASQRVLDALNEARLSGEGWLRTDVLMERSRVHKAQARVVELRQQGWLIECETDPDGSGLGRYRLRGKGKPSHKKLAGCKVWIFDDGKVEVTSAVGGSDSALTERLTRAIEEAVASFRSEPSVDLFDFLEAP